MYKNLISVLIIFWVTSATLAQTNLLKNPGFEDSVSIGWWLNAWGGAEAELFNETGANVISGNISAKVNVTKPDASTLPKVSLMSDPIVNVPEGDLILKLKARTESLFFKPMQISLKCLSANGDKKYLASGEYSLTTTPQEVEFTFSPEKIYRDTIYVRISCGTTEGAFIFDDVSFTVKQDTPPVDVIPTGRRLREIVADKFPEGNLYIGAATHGSLWGTSSEEILNREFSYITPANDFKQSYIHPEPGKWQWELPDGWVERAKTNEQVIRMHSPISPQCSKWAREDNRTADELSQNLEEYVTELCKHYNNEANIKWMDVVNETIDANTGEWMMPKPGTDKWENPWPKIGFDSTGSMVVPIYIIKAFELANKYAPNIKQIINQHGTMNDAAWNKVKELVYYLRDKGLRVDGIGFQAHVDVGWEKEGDNIKKLGELIDWAHQNNLEFHVTENNVSIKSGGNSQFGAQAETFKAIVKTVVSKSNSGLVSWNLWMLRDGIGQKGSFKPVLFNNDATPKPAYYAVQDVLENFTTDIINKANIPNKILLQNNYPNPFNPSTLIPFTLKNSSKIKLVIYDALGRIVKILIDSEYSAGNHSIVWNGNNISGKRVASGTYFARLYSNDEIQTIKMMLIQ